MSGARPRGETREKEKAEGDFFKRFKADALLEAKHDRRQRIKADQHVHVPHVVEGLAPKPVLQRLQQQADRERLPVQHQRFSGHQHVAVGHIEQTEHQHRDQQLFNRLFIEIKIIRVLGIIQKKSPRQHDEAGDGKARNAVVYHVIQYIIKFNRGIFFRRSHGPDKLSADMNDNHCHGADNAKEIEIRLPCRQSRLID